MKLIKNTIATLAVASTAMLPIMTSSASAHDRGFSHQHGNRGVHCGPRDRNCDGVRDQRRGQQRRHGISGGDAAGIAILGIIGGALIGSALQNNSQPRYVQPRTQPKPQRRYTTNDFPPAPRSTAPNVVTYGGSLEPWSRGWYEYCENRFRSFNPQKGTYRGYDGKDHFCVAK